MDEDGVEGKRGGLPEAAMEEVDGGEHRNKGAWAPPQRTKVISKQKSETEREFPRVP